jgi:hypothetical protein
VIFHKTVRNSLALGTAFAFFLLSAGCGSTTHPNQLNAFDGDTYDAFVAAHGALSSLRAEIQAAYPTYKDQFNEAAAAYATAYNSYVAYRVAPTANQAQVAVLVNNLAVSVAGLESAFEAGMHVSQAQLDAARKGARSARAGYDRKLANLSLSDILTDLEIAAAVAQTIPGASPYAALASLVIQATSSAVSAIEANNGQPITLDAIAPVTAL